MTIRFHSHVTIDEDARSQIIRGLNDLLAATIDLTSQVKQAHWNVRGSQFISRHTMFDQLYTRLVASTDMIAERVGQLGGYARGTVRMAGHTSALAEHDETAVQGDEHVRSLTDRYAELGAMFRHQIRVVEQFHEPVTVDLYTQALRSLELDLWFLESHLERGKGVGDTQDAPASKRDAKPAKEDGKSAKVAAPRARSAH
jgi:starvation-inducible DNA-binding protein